MGNVILVVLDLVELLRWPTVVVVGLVILARTVESWLFWQRIRDNRLQDPGQVYMNTEDQLA